MNEIFNVTPLPTTRLLQIIQGSKLVSEWTDSVIGNLLTQVDNNLAEKDVQGNVEVKRIFTELQGLLMAKDIQGLKAFFASRMAEGKELVETE